MDLTEIEASFKIYQSYWDELHCNRDKDAASLGLKPAQIPFRKNFNPVKIPTVLPHFTLIEVAENGALHHKLIGGNLEKIVPIIPKVLDINVLEKKDPWYEFTKAHNTMLQVPCGLRFENYVVLSTSETFTMHRYSLPYADIDGKFKFIISVSFSDKSFPFGSPSSAYVTKIKIKDLSPIDLGYGITDR